MLKIYDPFYSTVLVRYTNYQCKDLWKRSGNNRNKPFNRHSNYAYTTDANNNFHFCGKMIEV